MFAKHKLNWFEIVQNVFQDIWVANEYFKEYIIDANENNYI